MAFGRLVIGRRTRSPALRGPCEHAVAVVLDGGSRCRAVVRARGAAPSPCSSGFIASSERGRGAARSPTLVEVPPGCSVPQVGDRMRDRADPDGEVERVAQASAPRFYVGVT